MSSEEKNRSMEEEWARATGNPDNMIVSDSLIGRLGSSMLEEELPVDTFLQCTLMSTEGQVLSGRTASFEQSPEEKRVSFETTHETANQMLSFSTLEKVVFSFPTQEDEVVWEIMPNEKVSRKTEFFAQNDALITISLVSVKDEKDSNSYTIELEAGAIQ